MDTSKLVTVDQDVASIPAAALPRFNELREMVQKIIPQANELVGYGILGYKIDNKRARVFIV